MTSPQPDSPLDDDAELLRWLANRDAACPLCGYNLRALTSPRCPECGQQVRLSISAVDLHLAAWIVLLVFLCASGGLGFIFFIEILVHGFPPIGKIPLCTMIATAPLAVVAAFTRRRFQAIGRRVQWLAAISVALGVVILFIWLLALTR